MQTNIAMKFAGHVAYVNKKNTIDPEISNFSKKITFFARPV